MIAGAALQSSSNNKRGGLHTSHHSKDNIKDKIHFKNNKSNLMINVSEHPTLAHSLSSKRLKTPKEMQTPPIVERNGYHNQVPALKPTVQCFSVKNKGPQSSSQYKSPFAY